MGLKASRKRAGSSLDMKSVLCDHSEKKMPQFLGEESQPYQPVAKMVLGLLSETLPLNCRAPGEEINPSKPVIRV